MKPLIYSLHTFSVVIPFPHCRATYMFILYDFYVSLFYRVGHVCDPDRATPDYSP